VLPAVNATDATPLASVIAVAMFVPFENVPLAPDVGAANVTVTPLTSDPFEVTEAASWVTNGVPTTVFCPPPPVAAIDSVGGEIGDVEPPQPTRTSITRMHEYALSLMDIPYR